MPGPKPAEFVITNHAIDQWIMRIAPGTKERDKAKRTIRRVLRRATLFPTTTGSGAQMWFSAHPRCFFVVRSNKVVTVYSEHEGAELLNGKLTLSVEVSWGSNLGAAEAETKLLLYVRETIEGLKDLDDVRIADARVWRGV